jgi:chromosome segregation ATPase
MCTMATRKRPLCFDAHATHKRLKLEHATLKRFREEDSVFVMNKRTKCTTVQSELHDLKNEILKLQVSMSEMKQHQQMCYQIMSGQSAQIRQLEHKLQTAQCPIGEPWLQPVVHAH